MTIVRNLTGYRRLTKEGKAYFEDAIVSDPTRKVGDHSLLSLSGGIPSRKLGKTVQFDSASNEKAYVFLSELDDSVHLLLDQPPKISVVKTDAIDRRRPYKITVDYIEAGIDQFFLVEAKKTEDLLKLRAVSPSDWTDSEGGLWRYLPGEATASKYGMQFKVFRPEVYSKAFLANLAYRFRLTDSDCLTQQAGTIVAVRERLKKGALNVRQLCEQYQGVTGGLIMRAILNDLLFGLIDLQTFDDEFMVFHSPEAAETFRGEVSRLALVDRPFDPFTLRLLRASQVELEYAKKMMTRYDANRAMGLARKATDYRAEIRLRAALDAGSPRIAAFIPNFQGKGGVGCPIDADIKKSVKKQIKDFWKKSTCPRISNGYTDLESDTLKTGAFCPAPETYRRLFHETLAPEKAAFLAGGKRAFHQARPIVDGRDANPRSKICGMHAHIDGVYGDAYSKESEEAVFLRPIFYPLIDDVSGFVFGRGIKVGHPSRLPVGMALRDSYLRIGSLPAEVTRDGGSEFKEYFCEAAGGLGFISQQRPKGAPRFGGRGESFNATFNAFLQTVAGGSYFDKAGRAADGSKKGRKHATHEISSLVRIADNWIFNVWNTTAIGGESRSPAQLFAESRQMFPDAFVNVGDTPYSRYLTSFPINVGKFDYSRGVRFAGVRYSSRELVAVLRRGEVPTDPRLDCMDPSIIWARTNQGVIGLYSREHVRIGGMDIAIRMSELSRLLNYNVNAKLNQRTRRLREAAIREQVEQGMHAVSQSEHSQPQKRPFGNPTSSEPNVSAFAGISSGEFIPLRRFGGN